MAQAKPQGSGRVRFLLDECISHTYVKRLADRGYPDTIHPIHVGMRRARDDQIVARALMDDRIIISANARDYRKLFATAAIHPGAILVEGTDLETTWKQIVLGLSFIELRTAPIDWMVNRVVEVSASEGVRPFEIPGIDA